MRPAKFVSWLKGAVLISLFALGEGVVSLTELKVAYATQGG
jgi:hypothetical protein